MAVVLKWHETEPCGPNEPPIQCHTGISPLSASAGERAGERCRSNEFALIGAIRVKVFVFISSFSSLLAFVFSAFFTVKSPPSVIRVIRVSVFVLIMGSSDPLAWRGGRACHSARAVGLNPHAWVSKRGGQGTSRPTHVNGS